jgi:hypothetical protein
MAVQPERMFKPGTSEHVSIGQVGEDAAFVIVKGDVFGGCWNRLHKEELEIAIGINPIAGTIGDGIARDFRTRVPGGCDDCPLLDVIPND